ncbi:MAG: ATP-binding cassette domain-containing protein, partial [Clostridia bacterium]|nr:ATP-binding cassette domain-containing protein [Clostridia bacterium]
TGMVFLLGRSGSGKSTLLNVAGGLDKPDSGEVIVKGKSSKDFTGSDFDSYRNTFVGFVFQEYNILNEFNIEQNIALALQLQGKKNDKEAVNAILEQVDLAGMGKRKPNTLSGGQKQRV